MNTSKVLDTDRRLIYEHLMLHGGHNLKKILAPKSAHLSKEEVTRFLKELYFTETLYVLVGIVVVVLAIKGLKDKKFAKIAGWMTIGLLTLFIFIGSSEGFWSQSIALALLVSLCYYVGRFDVTSNSDGKSDQTTVAWLSMGTVIGGIVLSISGVILGRMSLLSFVNY